jgi:signal transduction histidine kinase
MSQHGTLMSKHAAENAGKSDLRFWPWIVGMFTTAGDKQPSRIPTSLQDELIWMHARQTRTTPVHLSLLAVFLTLPLFGRVPTWMVVGWFGLLLATSAIVLWTRWIRLRRPRRADIPRRKRMSLSVTFSVAYGIILALPLGFFPYLSESERLLESMVLVSIWYGGAFNTAGYLPAFLAFTLPSFTALVTWWVFSPGTSEDGSFHYMVAATVLFFWAGSCLVLSRAAFHWTRESFAMRMRQAELNRQLQAALEQAEAASRAKTRFLASASHDLRQPIHTVSLFGAALSMRPLDAESREIAQHMNTAVHVLAAQLDALLDISKLDAKVMRVEPVQIKLHDILQRLDEEFEPAARAKGLTLILDCPDDGFIETDQLLFERVIRNLLDNAIKYTDTGRVSVRVVNDGTDFGISIEDTGRGIPESEQTRVFEEFYQLDNPERDRRRGLGLGLPIVRRLTELLKIDLDMDSAPGRGTRFSLRLPAVEPAPRAVVPAVPEPETPRDLQVLVVDDEAEVRLGMKKLLEGMDHRVTLADGTAQALDQARACKPDIVFSDLRLRGEDNGIETIRAIRTLYPAMPALLISGDIAPARLREAEAAGIPLLHKPVPVEALRQALAKVAL